MKKFYCKWMVRSSSQQVVKRGETLALRAGRSPVLYAHFMQPQAYEMSGVVKSEDLTHLKTCSEADSLPP